MESVALKGLQPKTDIVAATSPKEAPRDREIREVAEKAQSVALDRLNSTSALPDYLRWHQAVQLITPRNIAWAWDESMDGEGYTAEELIQEQESEAFKKHAIQNASAAEALRESVVQLEEREGMMRVALKRVRDYTGLYTYRALAVFPQGTHAPDALDGKIPATDPTDDTPGIVFYEPENACVNHACDDLYKSHREEGAFYMPHQGLGESLRALQTSDNGATEYLLGKTESGNVTQDSENYVRVALLGGFSNENNLIRISDFWRTNGIDSKPSASPITSTFK